MSFRSYLIFMSIATTAAWIAWVVVLHGVDPTRSGFLGFVLFYTTLYMALFGSISVLSLIIRIWRSSGEVLSRVVMRSFRQGVLLSILVIGSLILFSQGWFRWWTMLLVVIIVSFVELAFISSRKS